MIQGEEVFEKVLSLWAGRTDLSELQF